MAFFFQIFFYLFQEPIKEFTDLMKYLVATLRVTEKVYSIIYTLLSLHDRLISVIQI